AIYTSYFTYKTQVYINKLVVEKQRKEHRKKPQFRNTILDTLPIRAEIIIANSIKLRQNSVRSDIIHPSIRFSILL
ncbi:MAG: hypothetical protein PHI32_08220, partial [Dysgonamonadaceae bacterium]|nr:hypothetical protein [Dysgonamonadaceae bacterium]MDD4729576.1 hypothetical protein [Dysgonamonadaceae bacterium]